MYIVTQRICSRCVYPKAGDVRHAEVFQDFSGRSKGCGIVEFEKVEDAEKAVAELNDTELEGRKIFVREVCLTGDGFGSMSWCGSFNRV